MNKLRLYSKFGMLLVVIGFFMPVACDKSGFQIAQFLIKQGKNNSGVVLCSILMYALIIAAILGVLIGVLLLANKKVSISYDWLTLLVSFGAGIVVYVRMFERVKDALQAGAWVMLVGWILAFVLLLLSGSGKKRR